MSDLLVLHPTNQAAAAGLAPYRSSLRVTLWLEGFQFLLAVPIMACVLFILLPMSLRDAEDLQKLQASGQKVTGVVENLWENRTGKRPAYWLRYRYTAPRPGGQPGSFAGTEKIPLKLYQRLKQGGPVEVRYLPEKPQVARLSSMLPTGPVVVQNPQLSNAVLAAGALGFCAVPLLMLRRVWPSLRREWRLEKQGRLLTGEVVCFNPSAVRFGRERFHLRYRFFTPEGQLVEGETWGRVIHLLGQNPLPGMPLGIWYSDPQHYVAL